jgi:hypothetical protein
MKQVVEAKPTASKCSVRGFFRVQLVNKKTKKIEGDSGWVENTLTQQGLNLMAGACAIAHSDSQPVVCAVLGSSATGVQSTQVSLAATISATRTFANANKSIINYGTAQLTCTFDGADHGGTHTFGTIALHGTNNGSQSMFAGQTFDSSQYTDAQDVNATYQVRFGTA